MKIFEPFYDPSDLSACVPASESIASLNARAAGDGIYFPLWRDSSESLGSLYLGTRVCSRSFRFGLVGDNVLGCRFRLKNGKTLDLGGRVVKNVVGLDLTRFFAGSAGALGEPETLILRLRPLPQVRKELGVHGAFESLERFRAAFMLSPWVHCVDAFDVELPRLALAYACTAEEAAVFEDSLGSLAKAHNCTLKEEPLPSHTGKRELRVPLSQALHQAKAQPGATGYLGHGTLLIQGAPEPGAQPALDERMAALLESLS